MALFTQVLSFGVQTPADSNGTKVTSTANAFDEYNLAVTGSAQHYVVSFTLANVVSFYLSSDTDCTINANDSGGDDYSLSVHANCPLIFYSTNCPWTLANMGITADTTDYYITVGSGTANIIIRILQQSGA